MAAKFNFYQYARPVRLYARGAIVLAVRTLRVAPKKPSKAVRAALTELRSTAEALRTQHSLRAANQPQNLKPIDRAFDSGWSSLRDRIAAWASNEHPDAAETRRLAAELTAAFFADGVSFVQLSYEEEWAESSERIVRWTQNPALRKGLVTVAGELFVANVELQHVRLGDALNLSGKAARADLDPRGIADALSAFGDALAEYIRVYGGEVDRKDPASIAAFVKAMGPLEAYRASTAIGANRDDIEEQDDVDADLPPVAGGGDADPGTEPESRDDAAAKDGAAKDGAAPAPTKPGLRGGNPFQD